MESRQSVLLEKRKAFFAEFYLQINKLRDIQSKRDLMEEEEKIITIRLEEIGAEINITADELLGIEYEYLIAAGL